MGPVFAGAGGRRAAARERRAPQTAPPFLEPPLLGARTEVQTPALKEGPRTATISFALPLLVFSALHHGARDRDPVTGTSRGW